MKTLLSLCSVVWLSAGLVHAQFVFDCVCLAQQPGLHVTNCQATIPDLCAVATNCFRGTVVPPPPLPPYQCSQNPPAGTPVGPGNHPITVTIQMSGLPPIQCLVTFQVTAPITGPFSLQCAPDKTVNCDATWSFDPPTVVNPCCPNAALPNGGALVSVVSTVTNGVCPQVITRTWRAVDQCGQTATCSQTVTVVDAVPPTINCGQNEVLQCGLSWDFTVPIISDNCTAPSDLVLSIVSTTTNFTCVPTFVATRVWKVTDLCGNSIMCTQVVTIIDTTPPTITCAPNKTVECGSNWTFDTPTASDFCMSFLGNGNVTIAVVSTVTNGTCPEVITRTWSATDGCGNSSQCSQTVTVADTTPPVLDCNCLRSNPAIPLSVVACSNAIPDLCPLTLTSATGVSCARDNCGPLTCSQSPAAGTVVGPGVYPITVTVTDCAGNKASCVLNFTVTAPPGGCDPCPDQTNSWNTGMSGGNPLPPGAPDPNYVLVSAPPGGCTGPAQVLNPATLPVGPWIPNGPNSQWIGAGPTADCQEGVYHYRLCFYIPCTEGASIIGQWAADDNAAMFLNGQPTGNTIPSPQFPNLPLYGWFPVNITNGFVCGINCLDFYVTNALIGVNPTGFRAELTNVFNDCCCPPPQPISTVFSGMDPVGGPLPIGVADPQFALTCAPPGVNLTTPITVQPHPNWVPNGPNSQWIGVDPSNFGPPGVYCYELRFNIPCPPGTPIKASLTGQWTADDWAEMYLNGQPTGHTVPSIQFPSTSFGGWHPINITSGFVPGVNTITFYVTNAGGPTGLRLELTNSASCCLCTNVNNCDCDFVNGDFSTAVPVNSTGGGWTSWDVFAGDGWQPSGGNPGGTFLLNNVGDPATDPTIAQQLCCLKPGQCYTIRGQRKVQAWFGQTQPSFAVLLDGAPILVLPVPSNPANANWYPFAVSFIATNSCQTIAFAAEYAGSDVSYWIDNITLECCPINPCTVSITCPPDTNVVSCSIVGGQVPVNYPLPAASSSCGVIASIACTPASGSLFPVGTTTVNCTATDVNGNSASCSFNVTVTGVPPLAIHCPQNITTNAACGAACMVVNYPPPTVVGGTLVGCNPPSGTCFPIGTTTVTCRAVNLCNDRASCQFTVTVLPYVIPCAQPPPSMALWLPFDEASGLAAGNLITGGNIGSLVNGVVHQLGSHVNNSLCFDGVNDYVQVAPYPAIMFGTGDFSIDAWIKPASFNNAIRIIVDHRDENTGPSVRGYSFFLGGGNGLAFQIGDGASFINYPSTLSVPADGQWHLVAVTVSRSNPNGIRFYVDGVIDPTPRDPTPYPASVSPPPSFPLRISSRSSSLSGFFPGCIDEVELFRRALSPSEIAAIYNAGKFGKCRPGSSGIVPPLVIKCPPDQTILTCSNSAIANFKPSASGHLGPIVCVPPSGSSFPIGTNMVTCSVTNICGATQFCSFKIIVKPYGPLSPTPSLVYWAGMPDNYAVGAEPANASACVMTAFSPAPFKPFDSTITERILSHRFTSLPNNVVKAVLVVRMKPSVDDPNTNNDTLSVGIGSSCTVASFVYSQAIRLLPGAVPPTGGTWVPSNGSTTFTIDLGAVNPALITKINTDQYLDVAIQDDTTVDYMQLRIWRCPPPIPGIGIPYELAGGATAALRATPIGLPNLPSLCVLPNLAVPNSGITLQPGAARAITFTTMLDFGAPDGAGIDVVLPGASPDEPPILSMHRKSNGNGYCIKTATKRGADSSGAYRAYVVNDNGDLLDSLSFSHSEIQANGILDILAQPGVTDCHVTIEVDCVSGGVTIEFAGPTTESSARKGWDGCIYGPDRPVKKPTSRVIVIPPTVPGQTPIVEVSLVSEGYPEVLLEDPLLTTLGRKWGDGHVTLMKAYDDGETERLSFIPIAPGGGVHTDLGRAESFSIGIHHFENGDIPNEEQLFRVIGGPPRGLTNRPPPPTIPLRLANIPEGVACTVDFSDYAAEAVTVQLYSHGMLIGEGMGEGPAITEDNALVLDRWPDRFGQLSVDGTLRLTSAELFTVSGLTGDEIRIIPTLPAGTELPEYIAGLECLAGEDSDNLLFGLQRTLACSPAALTITRTPDGLSITWPGDGNRLQGAESPDGPWFELGITSPVGLNASHKARFFRLVCD